MFQLLFVGWSRLFSLPKAGKPQVVSSFVSCSPCFLRCIANLNTKYKNISPANIAMDVSRLANGIQTKPSRASTTLADATTCQTNKGSLSCFITAKSYCHKISACHAYMMGVTQIKFGVKYGGTGQEIMGFIRQLAQQRSKPKVADAAIATGLLLTAFAPPATIVVNTPLALDAALLIPTVIVAETAALPKITQLRKQKGSRTPGGSTGIWIPADRIAMPHITSPGWQTSFPCGSTNDRGFPQA